MEEIITNNSEIEDWIPTTSLRWKLVDSNDPVIYNCCKILSWISDKGEEEWREIQMVK